MSIYLSKFLRLTWCFNCLITFVLAVFISLQQEEENVQKTKWDSNLGLARYNDKNVWLKNRLDNALIVCTYRYRSIRLALLLIKFDTSYSYSRKSASSSTSRFDFSLFFFFFDEKCIFLFCNIRDGARQSMTDENSHQFFLIKILSDSTYLE